MKKIYYISDIHLELYDYYENAMGVKPPDFNTYFKEADILVLAGDICSLNNMPLLNSFIEAASAFYKNVIYVPGNHEYYGVGFDEGIELLNYFQNNYDNVDVLDILLGHTSVEIDGVKFFGSTLWTDMNDCKSKYFVSSSLNDNKSIKTSSEVLLDLHNKTVESIDWEADVIITHHCPILREHSRHMMSDITYGFCCTMLEDKIKESDVKYWIFGHTHDNISEYVGNTLVTSNQIGYMFEHMTVEYSYKTVIV